MTAHNTAERVTWRPIKREAQQLAAQLAEQTREPHEVLGEIAVRDVDGSLRPVGS
jgi:hypothetical protein